MIFQDDNQAYEYIKQNAQLNPLFRKMRENSKELKALVNGEGFIDELLEKIEHIESDKKAMARIKYSRSIQDTFSRIF